MGRKRFFLAFVQHHGMARPAVSAALCSRCTLYDVGCAVLNERDPLMKAALTHDARKRFLRGELGIGGEEYAPDQWARRERPEIVDAEHMPKPKEVEGSQVLFYLHSLAHVELNAINLCWDSLVRFAGSCDMPTRYYEDLLRVADDESRHFEWLQKRLLDLNSEYGAYPAHDLIDRGAKATRANLLERLAIGQLVQEARGLDAAPRVAEKLLSWNDKESSRIVDRIGVEEVDHVRMGVTWYLHLCDRHGIDDPVARFHEIALKYGNYGAFSPPFNEARRLEAGLSQEWYMPVSEVVAQILEQRKLVRASRQKRPPSDTP